MSTTVREHCERHGGSVVETVTTDQLQDGDVLLHYGAELQLQGRRVHDLSRFDQRDCFTFRGILVNPGDVDDLDPWMLAIIQREGCWPIQGNELARWSRIV